MKKSKNLNKTVAIVSKNDQAISNKLQSLVQILQSFEYKVSFDLASAKILGLQGQTLKELTSQNELFISFGGDGTLISICRKLAYKNKQVIGVYAGNLGFLTDINLENLSEFLKDFENGNFLRFNPRMLRANLEFKDGALREVIAFNDICIMRDSSSSMAQIEAYFGQRHFNSYFGDGVIVSSAVGSTAYNMSASGPIIHPLSEVFCLTPVCPHSLSQRPLVLPADFEVTFKSVNKNVVVVIDGQESYKMRELNSIKIGLSQVKANLIRQTKRDYFDILKEKLRWGN